MHEIIKSVITSGRYELADMLKKIDTIWLQGSITDDQRAELVELARANADPANSYASLQKQVDVLYRNVAELVDRILKLENGGTETPTEEYPDYVQPTGAHDAYYTGAMITYNGVKYTCIAPEGVAVVWPPDVMPSYWQAEEVTY